MDLCVRERRKSILFEVKDDVYKVSARDILCSEAHKNIWKITLADGRDIDVRMTVGELFALLASSGSFVRCGAAYIINLAEIRRLNAKTVLISNGV